MLHGGVRRLIWYAFGSALRPNHPPPSRQIGVSISLAILRRGHISISSVRITYVDVSFSRLLWIFSYIASVVGSIGSPIIASPWVLVDVNTPIPKHQKSIYLINSNMLKSLRGPDLNRWDCQYSAGLAWTRLVGLVGYWSSSSSFNSQPIRNYTLISN